MLSNKLIPTLFCYTKKLNYGESVYVIGSHMSLGEWDITKSYELSVFEEIYWYITIPLPSNIEIEYKFFISPSKKNNLQSILWNEGFNHHLKILGKEKKLDSNEIGVLSFNIRYENKNDGIHCWENRKALVLSTILTIDAEIICLQESKPCQLSFIAKGLSGFYDFYYRGRDYENLDESCPIFYDRNRFLRLDQGIARLKKFYSKHG
jgi:hypothetical protein